MSLKINPESGTIQNKAGGGITLDPGNTDVVTISQGVFFPDGTVTAPSITFEDDTNTGFYSPVNESVAVTGAGGEIARFSGVSNSANYLSITSAVSSAPVTIAPNGTDLNVDLNLSAKGTGSVNISGLSYPNADGSATQVMKTDGSGNLAFGTIDYSELANAPVGVSVVSDLGDVDTVSKEQGWSLKYLNNEWVARPDWTIESNIGGPTVSDLVYGIVGAQGAGAVGTVQNVTVNFDIVTAGTIQYGSAIANAQDMAEAINRDLNAAGELRIVAYHKNDLLYLVNSEGGAINFTNVTNDSAGNPVFGPASATGLPLTIQGGAKGSIKANASGVYRDLAVGTNGQVLTADSTTETGLAWTTVSSGGAVDSVAGKTGVVTLVKADITDFSDADYATAAQGTLASTALQNINGQSVGELNDVDLTGNANNKFLQFNGSNFVPVDLPPATVPWGTFGGTVATAPVATGSNSIAIGTGTNSGGDSISIGINANAPGTSGASIAIGSNVQIVPENSFSGGSTNGLVFGSNSSAAGGSVAIGPGSNAIGVNGMTIGTSTIEAGTFNSLCFGHFNTIKNSGGGSVMLGIGFGDITTPMVRAGDGFGGRYLTYLLGDCKLQLTGPSAQYVLPNYTVASAPTNGETGSMIFVTDGASGSPTVAVHDGTSWKQVNLGPDISST